MKKILSLILILSLISTLFACDKSTGGSNDDDFTPETVDTSKMDFEFTDRDISGEYGDTVTEVSDYSATLTKSGTYVFRGEYGAITVDAEGEKVQIVLDGANISGEDCPAIYVKAAKKVFITLSEGSESTVSDGTEYSEELTSLSVDACIFSKADLTVNGSGSLSIIANYKHGLASKDDLVIASANLSVTAPSAGIEGKDCVKCKDASITIASGTDGLRSTNEEDSARGFVLVDNCNLNFTSGRDLIQAVTLVKITGGSIKLTSSAATVSSSESYKGIKSDLDIHIEGGSFTIDTEDDCIHANGSVVISGGDFTLTSGDDGIHADTDLHIKGGSINITKSYEGIEATNIYIAGGYITLVASDDGFNAAGGNDSGTGGAFGADPFSASEGTLTLAGGYVFVNASGDGLDSNGSLTISGGTIIVSGPTNSGNGALDYGGDAKISGGVLIALGASGMAQSIESDGYAGVIGCSFSTISANTAISVLDSDGNLVVSFAPPKSYSSAVIVTPNIISGETYSIYSGGLANGADENGFAEDGILIGGTLLGTISASEGYSGGGTPGGGGGRPGGR